jgi:NAD(P)-dependent dehydrogenase (short-subunit alcohol dehydrogenase family)
MGEDRIAGKVVAITGASSGIGEATAVLLAARGAALVLGAPELSKGLEFDPVVLIDPEAFGTGIQGAVDRYVAMTRATQQLVMLTSS